MRNVGPLIVYTPRRLKLWQLILIAALIVIALSIEEREPEQAAIQYVCSDLGCAASETPIPEER